MSQQLLDQLKTLTDLSKTANKQLEITKKAAKVGIELANRNATAKDIKKVQKATMQLNGIFDKAVKGESINEEVEKYAKQFKKDFNK